MYPKSYYPVNPEYAEKYHEISEHFLPKIEEILASLPPNYKNWRKHYLLIRGEDAYEQFVQAYRKNLVLDHHANKFSFLEYVTERLMWYSLVFDYKTANIFLLDKAPEGGEGVIWSSRLGPKLSKLLK